jgi:hypothetical protein
MSRRRRNGGASQFMHEHPWMTFFLASSAISGVVILFRGYQDFSALCPKPTPCPTPAPATTTPAVAGGTVQGIGWMDHPVMRAFGR